ncbi:MAG: hypothetical protein ACK5WS_00095 [Alphaproteobacteria bacterium]|jgi:hypothetical protein|nr:hypothetical protein [Candidatus Jidaibacter sp.]
MIDDILNSLDTGSKKIVSQIIKKFRDFKVEISNDNETHYAELIKSQKANQNPTHEIS